MEDMKELVLLGASGSIGTQTVDIVLQHPDLFHVRALSVGHNIKELRKILACLDTELICVQEEKDAEEDFLRAGHTRRSCPKKSGLWKSGRGVPTGLQLKKWGWAVLSPHL